MLSSHDTDANKDLSTVAEVGETQDGRTRQQLEG